MDDNFNERRTEAQKKVVDFLLNRIPTDTKGFDLALHLEPILEHVAKLSPPKIEAFLEMIKEKYSLKYHVVEAYRRQIRNLQRTQKDQSEVSERLPRVCEPIYVATNIPGLVDIVQYEGGLGFLLKDANGHVSIQEQIEYNGVVYDPPPREAIPWLPPDGEAVFRHYNEEKSYGELYDDLRNYHKSISELPDELYYDLLVSWDFHTYLIENFQYSPIVCFYAVQERGKSRTGEGLTYIARNGFRVESLRDAYIVRAAHDLEATIFFDIMNIWKKAEKTGSEDILLHRFERGAKVPRVLFPEKGAFRDVKYYSIFGPTIIASNESLHRILESRAIIINMKETNKQFENDVTPEAALTLRERLVAFRARHLNMPLQNTAKPCRGRLGDILKPLKQVIQLIRPNKMKDFEMLVSKIQRQRLDDRAESTEGQILKAILEIVKKDKSLPYEEKKIRNSILSIVDLREAVNDGRSKDYEYSPQFIGRRVTALGFERTRIEKGRKAIILDFNQLQVMTDSYGLNGNNLSSADSQMQADKYSETSECSQQKLIKALDVKEVPL